MNSNAAAFFAIKLVNFARRGQSASGPDRLFVSRLAGRLLPKPTTQQADLLASIKFPCC